MSAPIGYWFNHYLRSRRPDYDRTAAEGTATLTHLRVTQSRRPARKICRARNKTRPALALTPCQLGTLRWRPTAKGTSYDVVIPSMKFVMSRRDKRSSGPASGEVQRMLARPIRNVATDEALIGSV